MEDSRLDNSVFWCVDEKTANRLLSVLHEEGFKWDDGQSYIENNKWHEFKEKSCYNFRYGSVGSYEMYLHMEVEIIDADKYFKH